MRMSDTQFCAIALNEYDPFSFHNLLCSMSEVGSCADNDAAESFFGVLKREQSTRRQYRTRAEVRADIFDYIEHCHNPRKRRQLAILKGNDLVLTRPSVEAVVKPRTNSPSLSEGQRTWT